MHTVHASSDTVRSASLRKYVRKFRFQTYSFDLAHSMELFKGEKNSFAEVQHRTEKKIT